MNIILMILWSIIISMAILNFIYIGISIYYINQDIKKIMKKLDIKEE
jgi:hypothetical protein